jgi:hypothetical protein
MADLNADLDPHERLSLIVIGDGPWTVGNGLITPTLKIRRAALENHYYTLIEEWRAQGSPVVWETIPAVRMDAYPAVAIPENPGRHSDWPPSQT